MPLSEAAEIQLRTVVLIDGQNMYKGAREAFGWTEEKGHYGNFRPLGLARLLTSDPKRKLTQVRFYQGLPDPDRDKLGNAITHRRLASWKADDPGLVEIITRTLKYPPPQGREKGIDVRIAIDLVSLAADNAYDLAVLASADTDLLPAIEFVVQRFKLKMIEAVTWEPIPGCEYDTAAPLDVRGGGVIRRTVPKEDFDRYLQALACARATGLRGRCTDEVLGIAMSLAGQGDAVSAVRLAAAAHAEQEVLGKSSDQWWTSMQERLIGGARARLAANEHEQAEHADGEARFDAILDELLDAETELRRTEAP